MSTTKFYSKVSSVNCDNQPTILGHEKFHLDKQSKQANPVGTNKLANPPILGTLERLTVPKRDVYSTSTCNKSLKEVKDKAMGSHCR